RLMKLCTKCNRQIETRDTKATIVKIVCNYCLAPKERTIYVYLSKGGLVAYGRILEQTYGLEIYFSKEHYGREKDIVTEAVAISLAILDCFKITDYQTSNQKFTEKEWEVIREKIKEYPVVEVGK